MLRLVRLVRAKFDEVGKVGKRLESGWLMRGSPLVVLLLISNHTLPNTNTHTFMHIYELLHKHIQQSLPFSL